MKWRFLNTGVQDGAFNMAVDESLVVHCVTAAFPPVFRLYQWQPWTLSLGRMEDVERHLDLEQCESDGVPVVRRPTGGRAVFHAEEITYSFIARYADLPVSSSVAEVYRFVAGALVEGLRSAGVPAEVWPHGGTRGGRAPVAVGAARRGPCFASVSRYEICVGGKKLVGSAQRRWPGGVLQHGSILLGPAHRRIARYLRGASPGGEAALSECTTSVFESLGRSVEPGEVALGLSHAAEHVWDVRIERVGLSKAERTLVEHLVRSKYGCDDWNLGRAYARSEVWRTVGEGVD